MDNVFVIGDVHGNLDRLEALLKQEGLLVWCDDCDGGGTETEFFPGDQTAMVDCSVCKGLGWKRDRTDVIVVQLGDLADWGNSKRCSPTGDLLTYKYVTENMWCDVVLWGNHDRAMVDSQHDFSGFQPNYEASHYLTMLYDQGRLQLAFEAHGFLITHAGLTSAFKQQKVDEKLKTDPVAMADWLNEWDDKFLAAQMNPRGPRVAKDMDQNYLAITNAISTRRRGSSSVGGILWRDIQENLFDGYRQIFGHTADHEKHQVRMCSKKQTVRLDHGHNSAEKFAEMVGVAAAANMKPSYCIDIGGRPKDDAKSDCLAGIWLPSEKIVRVDL